MNDLQFHPCENCKPYFEQLHEFYEKEFRKLERRIVELERANIELKKENEKIKKKLLAYENPHTPPSKQRFPKRKKSTSPKKNGRPKGYPGSTRKFRKPDKTIILTAKKCPYCGKRMGKPDRVERRIVEDIPEPVQTTVTEFLQCYYTCPHCGKKVVTKHKDLPDTGNFGNNVLAHVTLMKYGDRMTYRKIKEALKRQHGLIITHSSLIDFIRRVSIKARREYGKILKRIRLSKVVHVDETSVKVDGKTYWIWIFLTETDILIAIRKSRGKRVLEEILGKDYQGTIVCDGLKVYLSFTTNLQRCWAHLLREAEYLAENLDGARALYEELKNLYKNLLETLSTDPPLDQRKLIRERGEKRLMTIICKNQSLGGEIQKLTNKVNNGFKYWFTFVTNPLVEPTNNAAERGLREHVVHRKIIGTLRNEWGTFTHETMMTVLQTWKQQGYNTYQKSMEVLRS